jgi:hypothetical protein
MMNVPGVLAAVAVLGLLSSCQSKSSSNERTNQLPRATEVFHLRSECAALGQKILDGNSVGSALSQSQASHYDPRTNRCYVELTVQTGDTNVALDYLSRILYDGQTGEMLAFARREKGKKSGMVFDKQHQVTTDNNAFYDDASAFIDKMMADDRKQ